MPSLKGLGSPATTGIVSLSLTPSSLFIVRKAHELGSRFHKANQSGCAPARITVLGNAKRVSRQLPAISLWLSAVGRMILFGSISMLGRCVVRTPRDRPPGTHARVLYL